VPNREVGEATKIGTLKMLGHDEVLNQARANVTERLTQQANARL